MSDPHSHCASAAPSGLCRQAHDRLGTGAWVCACNKRRRVGTKPKPCGSWADDGTGICAICTGTHYKLCTTHCSLPIGVDVRD